MTSARTRSQLWRLASLALFCGLPLLLLGLIVSNVTDATQADEQASQARATASAIVAQLEKHRARVVTPLDTASLYLTSASGSLASAEIQERATRLVEAAGGHLAEVQLTATPEQEADGAVAIQLSLDIDNKGLLDLLYAVESGLPLLTVTDVDVHKSTDQGDDRASGDGALRVEMTVRGHWRKGTG